MTDTKEQTVYRESGSEYLHPEALITITRQGYESLYVRTLLKDKAVLRVGAMGYRVIIKPSDKGWCCPSDRRVNLGMLNDTPQAREQTKAVFAGFPLYRPLSEEEEEALAAALEAVPSRAAGARDGTRLPIGPPPHQPAWLDPRWTYEARRSVRGR